MEFKLENKFNILDSFFFKKISSVIDFNSGLVFCIELDKTNESVQHYLRGFSGNTIEIIRINNKTIVRKTAKDIVQNSKIEMEIKKLNILFNLSTNNLAFDVPTILANGKNFEGHKFYELEFIPSESLDSCLAKLSPNKIKVISKKVFDIINILSKNPIKYNNSHINEEQFIIKKFQESLHSSTNKNFSSSLSVDLYEEYEKLIDKLEIKASHITNLQTFCHGDLALDNILLTRNDKIYLIDPLTNEFENIMWDIAKVLQSSMTYWNLIKYNNFQIDSSHKKIRLNPHEHIAMFHEHFLVHIEKYNQNTILIYLAATLARVIKYAKNEKQYCALLMITNELLSDYKEGRCDLNGSLSSMRR